MKLWTLALLLSLETSILFAQSGAGLEIKSDPPGTTVILNGEFRLTGVTPTTFSQPLSGRYELAASREGYETYHTTLNLTGGAPLQVSIKLSPKTRFKAFLRSAVVPGWGQFYAGERGRGILFGIATLATGATLAVTHIDYLSKKEDYDDLLEEFEEERSIERKKLLEERLDLVREEAYDAETVRNIALGAAAAVYVYNLLDALIFFPDKKYDSYVPRVSLDTGGDFSKIGLMVNLSF